MLNFLSRSNMWNLITKNVTVSFVCMTWSKKEEGWALYFIITNIWNIRIILLLTFFSFTSLICCLYKEGFDIKKVFYNTYIYHIWNNRILHLVLFYFTCQLFCYALKLIFVQNRISYKMPLHYTVQEWTSSLIGRYDFVHFVHFVRFYVSV